MAGLIVAFIFIIVIEIIDIVHEGEITMATQIAPTPILYGEEARRVIREAKTMPSEKSKENGQKLLNYFKRFTNK